MKVRRKIIKIDEELCNGCGQCVPDCAEGSLQIVDGKARLVADKLCDGLGACLGSCPTGALTIVEREADEFDEAAVEAYLAREQQDAAKGCASATLASFGPPPPCQQANAPASQQNAALSHWPVQIRLIPASAPFLEGADLVVVADCTALAHGSIQQEFIKDHVVMMGCPKFDDQELYIDRFSEILKTRHLASLTVLIMEVPCCSAMVQIMKKARQAAGSTLKVRQVVVSTRGQILGETTW